MRRAGSGGVPVIGAATSSSRLDSLTAIVPLLRSWLKLHSDRGETPGGASAPLLSALDGYTEDELSEYRQVFNMFDTGLATTLPRKS
ncbi:hypothetical protein ANCCEY_13896 [Ancylostoma ceylanicum]|uniref:Uncharacterized protein n=1 Tax=Ancylostoma ceylanicum TaxID=53326 RepID=A0A0D6L614_9BILA|nr:hypothetical protein ANCCEY_13896 [Ancylostoma ceylanicum]